MASLSTVLRLLSSLEKVFPEGACPPEGPVRGVMLKNEIFSFQTAYTSDGPADFSAAVSVESPLAECITLYPVECAPSMLPMYPEPERHDAGYLKTKPGLFPDILAPFRGKLRVAAGYWQSLWISVKPRGRVPAGVYPVGIVFTGPDGRKDSVCFELEILPLELPEQQLTVTQWFHSDCLADRYGVPVFSEEYWRIVENYLSAAAEYGMNMVLTPVFTPPLDTAVGGERTTVQLTDVTARDGSYTFGFRRLARWMDLAERCGIRRFEISHLFTQWGAKCAPKVMAETENGYRRIFGWETDSSSEEYTSFLRQFLRSLRAFLAERGALEQCVFHVSDEPSEEHLGNYRRCRDLIAAEMPDCTVIDALSSYRFYETGAVKKPVVATDHIGPFLEHGVPGLWAYYCCGQCRGVSNRFFAMPSCRNRVLGLQLYKFDIEGFLQWGFNFWNAARSERKIDPYAVTDGGGAFPSGDPFVVYPGENGTPVLSLRLVVFHEALQDLRALRLLESLSSRGETRRLMEEGFAAPLRFDCFPNTAAEILASRGRVNERLRRLAAGE